MASKPDIAAEKKAVKTALSESRSAPISFAALVTKGGIVLETDRRKSVDAVKKTAKAKGGGTRGAWGEMTSTGSSITLICDEDPASKIDQMVRKYFADRGQSVKVEVMLRADAEAAAAKEEKDPVAAPVKEVPAASGPEEKHEPAVAARPDMEEPTGAQPDEKGPAAAPDEKMPAASGSEEQEAARRQDAPADAALNDGSPDPDGPEEEEDAPIDAAREAPDGDLPDDPDDPDDEDDIAAQAGDLHSLLKAAKRKPYKFALLLGKKAPVWKGHRRRSTKKLMMAARQEGASPRGAWGTMQVEGKKVVLTCEETPPKSLARRARTFLKDNNLAYKVVCVLPSGEMLESEDAEELGEDTGEIPAATPETDAPESPAPQDTVGKSPAMSAQMVAQLDTAGKVIAHFADAPLDVARLQTLQDAARAAAEAGDETGASRKLAELANLARATPRTPVARRNRSIGALIDMKSDIKETAQTHEFARGYLTDLCKSCVAAADAGDFNTSDRKVGQVQRALAAAKAGPLDDNQLETVVAGMVPSAETAPSEFARIGNFLKPVLESDHPERPDVELSVGAYKDATARQDTPGVLTAIGDLRRHEATIDGLGHRHGEGGAMSQPLKPASVARLSALLARETGQ